MATAAARPQFQGVVFVGNAIGVAQVEAEVAFRPLGSNASLLQGKLLADVPGDYVFRLGDGSSSRWRALSPVEPGFDTPADPVIFEDSFSPTHELQHANRAWGFWDVEGVSEECLFTKTEEGLHIEATDQDLCTISAAPWASTFNFFAQWLQFEVSGIRLPRHGAAQLSLRPRVAGLNEEAILTLVLSSRKSDSNATMLGVDLVAVSSNVSSLPPVQLLSLEMPLPSGAIDAALSLNALNFSLELRSAGAAFGTPTSGEHGIDFRGWGDGSGETFLQIGGKPDVVLGAVSVSVPPLDPLTGTFDPLRPLCDATSCPPSLPAVLTPITDEVGGVNAAVLPLGLMQPLARFGLVDVTRPPFSADPTGVEDSTSSIQRAVDWARANYAVVFLPVGDYKVTDTIFAQQVTRRMATGHVPGQVVSLDGSHGTTHDFILDGVSSRYVPNYMRGEQALTRSGRRATLVLPPRTPGFTDRSLPKYVVHYQFTNPSGDAEPNAQYNSVFMGIDIRIDEGNFGAVGIRLRGAQGSGLEDVTVFAGDALVGVAGGCGSGAMHSNVTVVGGDYGLDLRQSQPAATVSALQLRGQRCAALVYEGFETLTVVGARVADQQLQANCSAVIAGFNLTRILGSGPCALPLLDPQPQQTNAAIAGSMIFTDASFDLSSDGSSNCINGKSAVSSERSLYLSNVHVKGAEPSIARFGGPDRASSSLPSAPGGGATDWSLVREFAHGERPGPLHRGHTTWQFEAPAYVEGARLPTGQDIVDVAYADGAGSSFPPSADLVERHVWGGKVLVSGVSAPRSAPSFPSFECSSALNVKLSPFGARGDGTQDDWEAIQAALDAAGAHGKQSGHFGRDESCGSAVVWLPRGMYAVSAPLQVPQGVALVGLARHLSRVVPHVAGLRRVPGRWQPLTAGPLPVIEMLPPRTPHGEVPGSVLAFLSASVWNSDADTSALHWHAFGGVYRQFHANRANRCGSKGGAGCLLPVEINHPLQLVSGGHLSAYTFYLEDCCREAQLPDPDYTSWPGFLAGPQGPHYRHLKVEKSSGPISFYHLNCEHGTGEAICEFEHSSDIDVFGFKTEGNFVSLWVRDCDNVRLLGTGGCGCSANTTTYPPRYATGYAPSLYRFERVTNFVAASVEDQMSILEPGFTPEGNEFNETGCQPYNILADIDGPNVPGRSVVDVLDRPVVVKRGGARKVHADASKVYV